MIRSRLGNTKAPLDVGFALILLALGESQVWTGWHDGGIGQVPTGHQLARAFLLVAMVAPLARRRRYPLLAAGVTCAGISIHVLALAYVPFLTGLLPMAVCNYTAAAYARDWRATSLLAVLATEAVIYWQIPEERAGGEVLFALFVALGTWLAGDVVRSRLHRADQTVREAESTIVEYEAATARILAEERARIARELHDVIAHSVSVMGVQAGAARTLLDTDPEAARTALRAIETTARSSVGELTRLLTVLRGEGEAAPERAPQPSLAQLPALVEQIRQAGLPVELSMPDSAPLPAGVDLAAFRIVQEALTNSLKHAGAPTRVELRRIDGRLVIEVKDSGPGRGDPESRTGHGLIGMRERAALYGGSVHAGPHPDGGFIVRASLPASADSIS